MSTSEQETASEQQHLSNGNSRYRGYCCRRFGDGYYTFEVDDFRTFIDDIAPSFLDIKDQYIWRGARNPCWPLQSSLSRRIESLKVESEDEWKGKASQLTKKHVVWFMERMRGLHLLKPEHDDLYRVLIELNYHEHKSFVAVLRELGPIREQVLKEVFSIGQHHGLYTPFLDWTDVPIIALFFAFVEEDDAAQPENVGNRVVYALNRTLVMEKFPQSASEYGDDSILFLGSMGHNNPRIIGQSGLFTYIPAHQPVDEWVVKNWSSSDKPVLIRFLIRNENRVRCLRQLAAHNVHYRSLFPDLHGAANQSNYLLLDEVAREHK